MLTTMYQKPLKQIVSDILKQQGPTHRQLIQGIDDSMRSLLVAAQYQAMGRPLLVVTPDGKTAQNLIQDLNQLLPEEEVYSYPAEESLALEYSLASRDNTTERVRSLNFLTSGQAGVVVTTLAGVRQRLTRPEDWAQSLTQLTVGDDLPREDLIAQLQYLGYQSQPMVQVPGEYSVRGSIMDVYPLTSVDPVRLDFFDTELDSIRYFDADSQESIANVRSVRLTPVEDILLTRDQQIYLAQEIQNKLPQQLAQIEDRDLVDRLEVQLGEMTAAVLAGDRDLTYPTAYLSLLEGPSYSLLDYLGEDGYLMTFDYGKMQQLEAQAHQEDMFWIEQEVQLGRLMPGLKLKHQASDLLIDYTGDHLMFILLQRGLKGITFDAIHTVNYRSMNQFFNQWDLVRTEVKQWLEEGYIIQVLASNRQEARKMVNLFEEHQVGRCSIQDGSIPTQGVINVVVGQLHRGFELLDYRWAVLTEHELFHKQRHRVTRQRQLSNAERIKSYSELSVGDYVVHTSHGIGRYTGLETLELGGVHKDLLAIEYQEGARVLIPVDQLNTLQKYIASEGKTPKLNKLGGKEWAKTKQKVQSKIEDIADELINLYAQREQEKGYAFGPDTPEQNEFEAAFEYVETPDQLRSSEEIKRDMEKERPMDRLLVGDVGYGKTEVAMRAIFKAVMEGKQVAFLVPTTILAQQHYQSIIERFADYPFEVGLLSRFVTKKQQDETIDGLETGCISIVVGTHRILSKDVIFNDLGLLIVDEEQRFGVRHKERLKQLKANVDVLTLTATPIPRTLNMSLIGVRDLSLIETPPNNRFPVQTYVMERNEEAIRTAIERELSRGGQVFYLYNRVATIHQRAQELSDLVPEARIAVAHGQLSERELEGVLLDFIQGEYDVLVTTTIIETGVDIPNANTLFIENADHMGLSTLYQIRGRVGRTHRVAYAYLMYEPFKQLSEVSEKRLNAIREFTELGSGFKIAMRDLSIRGAGNLLGQQQSGFIDSVGFDMYSHMLKQAVDRRRGKSPEHVNIRQANIDWDVNINAYIPERYIEDKTQKIGIYKLIQKIDSEATYREVQDQLIDRFGEFPDEVADLLDVALIRTYALEAGVTKIKQAKQTLSVWYNEASSDQLKGPGIFEALSKVPLKAEIQLETAGLRVDLDITGKDSYEWLDALIHLTRDSCQIIERQFEAADLNE